MVAVHIRAVVGWSSMVVDSRPQIVEVRVYTTKACLRKESFLLFPLMEDRFLVLDKLRVSDFPQPRRYLMKVLNASGKVFWKQTWAFRSLESEKP